MREDMRSGEWRGNILLVDDNADLLDTVAEDLTTLGYHVAVASDGAHALQLAERTAPDLALVDLRMPGISGWEVARRLRARFGSHILLFAHTGWSAPGDHERATAAGFDGLLKKPARLVQLRALAQEAAARSERRQPDGSTIDAEVSRPSLRAGGP